MDESIVGKRGWKDNSTKKKNSTRLFVIKQELEGTSKKRRQDGLDRGGRQGCQEQFIFGEKIGTPDKWQIAPRRGGHRQRTPEGKRDLHSARYLRRRVKKKDEKMGIKSSRRRGWP